jgi:protein ImuB
MSSRVRRTAGWHGTGRRTAAQHTAAASVTADLFAEGRESNHPVAVPAVIPHALIRPQAKQLWYAAVFPELTEPQATVTLQRLSLSAQQFTSLVSIEMPNALLLEIKGSVKLFGSLESLHTDIDAAWSRLALRVHSAAAPTALAALWLARAGKRVRIEDCGSLASGLAQLPIACTSWEPEWLLTLRAMGVNRLGELLRLPRSGVSRRLSPAAIMDLDIALAKQAAPRRAVVPRERFRERCDFETEIETVLYLQKALEPLIERCARFLRKRQAGVQAMELKLRHRVVPMTRIRLGLASITSECRRLADVLDEKLNRLELAAPVRGLVLVSGALLPLSAGSLDAFAGLRGGGRDTAPQLVERLRARLGETAVYGVSSVAEHRPEAAWQRVHELRLSAATRVSEGRLNEGRVSTLQAGDSCMGPLGASELCIAGHDMPRPVWLLAEPVPLAADGLILEEGPERIESGWWDGKGVARDYYIARPSHGAKWWVFQERQTKCWYLHGVFA